VNQVYAGAEELCSALDVGGFAEEGTIDLDEIG